MVTVMNRLDARSDQSHQAHGLRGQSGHSPVMDVPLRRDVALSARGLVTASTAQPVGAGVQHSAEVNTSSVSRG